MTKTAITADLHLNNSNYGRMDKNGLSFRSKDFMKAFEFFVDQCIDVVKPDGVVLVGDEYENPHPPNPIRKFLNRQLKRLAKAGIKVEVLVGNHDSCYFDHALLPIEEAGFEGVRVHFSASFIQESGVAMVFIPHTQEVERRETTHKMLVREVGNKYAKDIAQAKRDGYPVLAFGHFGVCGVEMNDGILNHNKDDVSLEDLGGLEADAIFLGHYHADQELHVPGTPRAMYVGSLERSTFNDKSEMKSFVVVETERGVKPVISRVEYPNARPMITVSGNSQQIKDRIESIKASVGQEGMEPIIKVKFAGTTTEYAEFCKDRKGIRDDLSGAKHIAFEKDVTDPDKEAKADSVRDQIAKKADVGSSDILEIFEAYLKAAIEDETERKAVVELAASIVASVNEKDKTSRGVVPGRTRIHGVKLNNFQMYGTDKNVVEFDQGCKNFFGRIGLVKGDDWSVVRDEASVFLSELPENERKLFSIVGKIEGDENESNGAGKSSILDSISWAFYEKIVRDFFDKESAKGSSTTSVVRTINDVPERECYVEVLFSAGKSLYLIRRECKFTSSGNHSGGVFLYCLYSPEGSSDSGSMTGKRGADAEIFIDQLVSMDFDTFSNSVMFGQSDADKFIRGTDKVKKEIFVKILGLMILDSYLAEARSRKSLVEKEMSSLDAQVSALSANTMTADEIEEAEKNVKALQAEIEEEEKKVAKLSASVKSLQSDPIFAKEGEINSEIEKNKALMAQRIEEAKRSCKASADAKAAEEVVLANHLKADSAATRLVADCQGSLDRAQEKVDSFDEAACKKLIGLAEQASQAKPTREAEKAKLQGQREAINLAAAEIQGQISSLGTAVGKFKKAVANMGASDEAKCPECENSVAKAHIEEKVRTGEAEIAKARLAKAKVEEPLDGIQTALNEVCKRLSNIEEYIGKGASSAAKIEEHKGNLNALESAKKRLEDAKSNKSGVEDRIATSRKTIAGHKNAVDKANEEAASDNKTLGEKVAELNKQIVDEVVPVKKSIEKSISASENAAAVANGLVRTKSSEKAGLAARIDVSKKTSAKVESAKAALEKSTADLSRLAFVEDGFGLNGIRVQIIEKYVPLLNVYVSEFMDVISNKMSMSVVTDGKRDGKMEIKVKGSSGSDPRQLSKGQFAKLKVATDLALGMMSLARNENAPDFVCLDEVFAPVDVNGKKAMFDVILKLQEYFRMVIVISHDPMVQENIKDTIVVNMVNDTSTIEKQAYEH